ncbi:DUF4202 domain-containing protein [Reichenbachiella sp. MALMAid0571]|uniref:DUF4202 domain-containing protein n=1 Tax=Reichenbachiella sp. MALMAid0571 TaxID=3143939 RepID=UPI0032DF4F8D
MKISNIFAKIDEINVQDPNIEESEGQSYPKEILYSQRMTDMLHDYVTNPSEALQIAARGQHIKRWSIPRSDYPMDRKGYLKWRTQLKIFHGELVAEILKSEECSEDFIKEVVELITKKNLKKDSQSKTLEDVICLVFLKYYFKDFAAKSTHEKLIDIVQKTWGKMTEQGHEAALKLPFEEKELKIIKEALA